MLQEFEVLDVVALQLAGAISASPQESCSTSASEQAVGMLLDGSNSLIAVSRLAKAVLR